MWLTSIAMCYLDCFIDNLNYTFQDFLILLSAKTQKGINIPPEAL